MGYGIFANAGNTIYVPPYNPALTYEEASSKLSEDGKEWFGAAGFVHKAQRRLAGDTGLMGSAAWNGVVGALYRIYGINPNDIQAGQYRWFTNFAANRKAVCPSKVDSH